MQQRWTAAQTFRAARVQAGLSVAELAELCGVARQTIFKIEAGVHPKPRMATTRAVAEATGVPVTDLVPLEEVA